MLGRELIIKRKDSGEDKLLAIVQSFWRSGKSRYRKQHSPIGLTMDDYYCYIGFPKYDITQLTDDDIVIFDNKSFCFVNAEPVRVNNKIQYYYGTLKRIWEDD